MSARSTYTPEIGAEICRRLADGQSLLSITRELGIPYSTAKGWEIDIEEHAANSLRAREIGCHYMAEECPEIADDGRNDWMENNHPDNPGWRANGENVQRSRLRIDTRLRLLGKWLPKVYGEKQQIEHGGQVGITVVVNKLAQEKAPGEG